IMVYARAWSARHKRPGQHRGPLTRATLEVLEALLWGFHNSRDGRCFPSYETIAARAQCCRDTVYEAIKALELAGVLTWVNRLIRVQFKELDLFGKLALRSRLIRTSNAYIFRDPLPCAPTPTQSRAGALSDAAGLALSSKSENLLGTLNQDILTLREETSHPKTDLEKALAKFQTALSTKKSSITR
ncbi:MAG: hypothetical protein B7Z81_10945, partial [Acidocella sp. 20-61-6]